MSQDNITRHVQIQQLELEELEDKIEVALKKLKNEPKPNILYECEFNRLVEKYRYVTGKPYMLKGYKNDQ